MRSEGYCTWFVCLCVSLSPLILALQGPSRLISDTNGSSATRARKVMWQFCLNGGLSIQVQWNIGSFTMERRECSNDNSVSASLWRGYTAGSS